MAMGDFNGWGWNTATYTNTTWQYTDNSTTDTYRYTPPPPTQPYTVYVNQPQWAAAEPKKKADDAFSWLRDRVDAIVDIGELALAA